MDNCEAIDQSHPESFLWNTVVPHEKLLTMTAALVDIQMTQYNSAYTMQMAG
jgi:hypothetical protein